MKKRKNNCNLKRLLVQTRLAVADLALKMRLNSAEKGVDIVKYKTGVPVAIGQSVATALDSTQFKWAVLLTVYAKESNGKDKTLTKWVRLAAPYRHNELTDWLRGEHQEMIDNCKAEVVDCGWIALPVPPKFVSDEQEERLIDNLKDLLEDNQAQHLISRRDTATINQGAHQ